MAAGTMIPLLLSDLKNLVPGTNANDRYYLTDNGKEGEFYLENTYTVPAQTPPTADDAITVNSNNLSGTVYRYRRINTNGLIDVRWFGAKGDGTDESTAIQAALTTQEGKTIIFDAPAGGNFVINTITVNVPTGKVLKFMPGNKLSGTATINGGIIDAGYRQQIFDTTLTLTPAGCLNNMVSVMWFGAGIAADSQPAIQKAVDVVVANSYLPKTVYFPRGQYVINAPIIVANYIASAQKYEQCTVLLKGEEAGTNRFSGLGANIIANFKDRFAIGFQIAKSGGIQSLSIVGQYAVPAMASDVFFNNNSFASYGDATCRDAIYSPYSAVVIDPFRANSLPPDGGYPGNDGAGVALSTYYTKAPNNVPNSGSSGLYFKDLNISNFTVCMIQSPNGQTQNGEGIIYEDIQVSNCKLGFASCQGQEKANSYKNIICWGTTHTVFSNRDYGIVGSAGNIVIDNVNVAGAVNRVFNWSAGGWFPSYFRNIYAESLGAVGTLISGGVTCTVENSLFDFVYPLEGGNYYPDYHINLSREISIRNCVMRIYGTGLPILISGSGSFHECSFETTPVTRVEEGSSSADTTQFINCISGTLGSREILRGSINQFYGYSLYGDYRLSDATNEYYGAYGEYALKYHKPRAFINTGSNSAITISGANRSFTLTTPYYAFYKVGEPVILKGASFVFGGIITAVNAGTTTVTVSYTPASVTNGTYIVCPYLNIKPFRILGDITSGSNQVTNVANGGFPGAIGDFVYLPEFEGAAIITNISGSTYTFNRNAMFTKTGVTLVPSAIQYTFNSLNPYAPLQIDANTVFKKGDIIIDTYQGITRKYICIADGMFNPADGRKACFTLDGNIENSLSANGSVVIPAGFMIEGFILKSNVNMGAVTIGTTNGGTDISSGLALTANVSKVQDWKYFTDSVTNIYFGGISGGTLNIRVIIKSV